MNLRNILGIIWSLVEARPYRWILLGLFLIEAGLISFGRNAFGWYLSPVVLFLVSALIGLVPLLLGQKKQLSDAHLHGNLRVRALLVFGLILLGSFFTIQWSRELWGEHPITVLESDIIPSVQLFAQRLMGGADGLPVYAPYDGFGYRLDPTYLPFQWLPFVVSEYAGVDPRWVPLLVWISGVLFFGYYLVSRKLSLGWTAGLALAPFWVLWCIRNAQPQMIYLTIELMDVGYYLFLGWSLLRGNILARSTGFVLTLLSRFSHLFWAPFYFIGLFFSNNRNDAIKLALIVGAGILAIYVLPFLSRDWESFGRGQEHYTRAAVGAWSTSYDDNPLPYDLRHGAGLAIYFYQGDEVPLEKQIHRLKVVHLSLSFLVAALIGLGYLFWGKGRFEIGYYFVFGLKVYFAVFYGFIQVPYTYLYQVPLFLSLLILVAAGEGRLLRK